MLKKIVFGKKTSSMSDVKRKNENFINRAASNVGWISLNNYLNNDRLIIIIITSYLVVFRGWNTMSGISPSAWLREYDESV